jgi:hypothetical protein
VTGRDGHSLLDDAAVEGLLTDGAGATHADLQQAVALLGTLAEGPAPRPNAALADVLDRGFEPTVVPFRRPAVPRRRWAARAGAGLAAAAASVVVAGSAAALPAPVQDTVADLVGALTPFELPRPPAAEDRFEPAGSAEHDGAAPSATPEPSAVPSSSAGATGGPTARATDDSPETKHGDAADDSSTAQRQERDRQRAAEEAAEESQRAAEEAAEESQRAADDAADEAADAAEDAAREREDAADDAADEAEDAERRDED